MHDERYQSIISYANFAEELNKCEDLSADDPAQKPAAVLFIVSTIVSAQTREKVGRECRWCGGVGAWRKGQGATKRGGEKRLASLPCLCSARSPEQLHFSVLGFSVAGAACPVAAAHLAR